MNLSIVSQYASLLKANIKSYERGSVLNSPAEVEIGKTYTREELSQQDSPFPLEQLNTFSRCYENGPHETEISDGTTVYKVKVSVQDRRCQSVEVLQKIRDIGKSK